jgi:kynurenine formamidase
VRHRRDGGCGARSDFLLTPERLEAWEREHGRIPAGAWVLLRTGWSRRPRRPISERVGRRAAQPGFDARASRLLAHDRDILGVGVETIGTDAGQAGGFDPPFPNHTIMHGAGKFGLASLCNLDRLPPTGAVVIAAPLKIVTAAAARCGPRDRASETRIRDHEQAIKSQEFVFPQKKTS